MTTVTIVAVSLVALGAFVWSLIPIEEVTGRRQDGSTSRRAGTAWRRAGTAWERAGTAWQQAGRALKGRTEAAGHALRERAAARERVRVRAAPRPRFEQAHDVTGPVLLREDRLPVPVAGETDSPGSRTLAALELILLVVLLGGLVALAALGGAEILRHAFSRLGG